MIPDLHALILAGGAGERFWPLSRRARPKPFLELSGGESLLAATYRRACAVAGADRIWVICGRDHVRTAREQTALPRRRILVEPRPRNTALAVGVAAARIGAREPEALLLVLPADHVIPDTAAFGRAVQRSARAARSEGVLVTLGVRPTRPETGYGYIRVGPSVGRRHPGLHRVRRFVEKPEAPRARRFLRNGGYLWNSGIFVWTARAILDEIKAHAPGVHRALAPLRRRPRGTLAAALEAVYRRAPSVPIDRAVLEKSRRVWTLPVDFHWSDLGTWLSLAEELGVKPDESRVLSGDVLLEDAPGNLVRAQDRPLVLLGVEGLAVVDAGDAVLVTRLERSGELRRVLRRLRREGREDLL